jgi:hypothetical protein
VEDATHFSKGLSEVLGEAIVQNGINKTIGVREDVAEDLYGHADPRGLVQLQRLEYEHNLQDIKRKERVTLMGTTTIKGRRVSHFHGH